MTPQQHMEKAERLEASRKRLDPDRDFELLVWSSIHGGAQLLNVAYHRGGFTPEDWDMIHTWVPETPGPVPTEFTELNDRLRAIEALGPRLVRGAEPWDPEIGRRCLQDYAVLKRLALAALDGPSGSR